MKIYIAGKVTGIPIESAREKFARSEQQLINAGVSPGQIVNPMKLGISEDDAWHCAMEICKSHLEKCTAIYVQNDWRDSFGARQELTMAQRLRLDTFFEEMNDMAMISNLIQNGI
jgi:hypothetical protein